MILRTRHFFIYFGYAAACDLQKQIFIGLWPQPRPAQPRLDVPAFLAWVSFSWNWLPTFSWIEHEYRIPIKRDDSHIPASLWTGRKRSLAKWSWPHSFSFHPVNPKDI